MSDESILVVAILIGIIPGAIAQQKGHSFIGWWLFGAILFILALPMSLFLKNERSAPCEFCKKTIDREATVCPYCQREVAPVEAPAAA